jgi:hypothetical protein
LAVSPQFCLEQEATYFPEFNSEGLHRAPIGK